jgi:uncharacterized membrane protein HdeD (DUF308 family)
MEDQALQAPRRVNGPLTVLISTLLTLAGIFGVAVGIAEFGLQPARWSVNAPHAMPILVSGILDLLAGTAMGFFHYRRALLLLIFAVACRVLWYMLAQWGWLNTGRGTLEFIGLLLAWWLVRNVGPGPNNSSKPTPLRGAA